MFPDSWTKALKQCGWGLGNTSCSPYEHTFIPDWRNLTGTEAIRSFVYWKFRETQIFHVAQTLWETVASSELETLIEQSLPSKFINLSNEHREKLKSGDFEAFDEVYQFVDRGVFASIDELMLVSCLLRLMDSIVEARPKRWCEHCKFWVAHIYDTRKLEYSPRYDIITYTNALRLPAKFDSKCVCENSFFLANPIYLRAMKVIWNADHGFVENSPYNPFTSVEYRRNVNMTENFLIKAYEFAKDWWRFVALPFVGMVLTFLYEHFGKIIALLVSLYSIYRIYTGTTTPTDAKLAGAAVHGAARAAVGSLVAQGISKVFSSEESASSEGSNYYNIDKSKAAKAPPMPAAREGAIDPGAIVEERLKIILAGLLCVKYCHLVNGLKRMVSV